jgi:hypothetical protein
MEALSNSSSDSPWDKLDASFANLVANREQCPDITPNGLLAPKIETMRAYEEVVLALWGLLTSALGASTLLFIDGAPNVRLKLGLEPEENLSRPRSTEAPHLDCCAGTSSDSVNMFIPLGGDVARNTESLFRVPNTWSEEWTSQRSYHDASEIVSQYEEISFAELPPPKIGEAILWDSSVLHKTTRLSPCQARLSIDLHFTPKKPKSQSNISEAELRRRLDCNEPGMDLSGEKIAGLSRTTNLKVDAHRGEVVQVQKGRHPAGIYWQ